MPFLPTNPISSLRFTTLRRQFPQTTNFGLRIAYGGSNHYAFKWRIRQSRDPFVIDHFIAQNDSI